MWLKHASMFGQRLRRGLALRSRFLMAKRRLAQPKSELLTIVESLEAKNRRLRRKLRESRQRSLWGQDLATQTTQSQAEEGCQTCPSISLPIDFLYAEVERLNRHRCLVLC